jgi:hypothetical protein
MATRASHEHIGADPRSNDGPEGHMSIDSEKTIEAEVPDHPQEPQEANKQVDVPPDGGYGWVCTACVFLINAHTWGVNSVNP